MKNKNTKITKNNKKSKKLNLVELIEKETTPVKKIFLLKRRNKSLKKKIYITNSIFYTLAVIASIPLHMVTTEMISVVTNYYHHQALLLMSIGFYYCIAIGIYLYSIYPSLLAAEKEISNNSDMITYLSEYEDPEVKKLVDRAKFHRNLRCLNNIE